MPDTERTVLCVCSLFFDEKKRLSPDVCVCLLQVGPHENMAKGNWMFEHELSGTFRGNANEKKYDEHTLVTAGPNY